MWASTYRAKLKTIHFHQKHDVRIVFNEDKLTQSRPLLQSLNALNIYQINLYQHLAFMYKLNKNKAPLTFNELIKKPFHKYPTKFSEKCFSLKAIFLKSTKYCISFHGPKIWNTFFQRKRWYYNCFQFLKKLPTQNYLKMSMNFKIFELNYCHII